MSVNLSTSAEFIGAFTALATEKSQLEAENARLNAELKKAQGSFYGASDKPGHYYGLICPTCTRPIQLHEKDFSISRDGTGGGYGGGSDSGYDVTKIKCNACFEDFKYKEDFETLVKTHIIFKIRHH